MFETFTTTVSKELLHSKNINRVLMNFPTSNRLRLAPGWYLVSNKFLQWSVVADAEQVWCEAERGTWIKLKDRRDPDEYICEKQLTRILLSARPI